MPSIEFFVEGTAAPGGSKKAFISRATGKMIVKDDAKFNKEWRAKVAAEALCAMHKAGFSLFPLAGALRLDILFTRERPRSHFGRNKQGLYLKAAAPRFPITKPDATKLTRSTEDAISTAGLWNDDAQVALQMIKKEYGYPVGARIRVTTLEAWGQTAIEEAMESLDALNFALEASGMEE